MNNLSRSALAMLTSVSFVACGGGESNAGAPAGDAPQTPGAGSAPTATGGLPTWYRVNGNAIEIDIVAGATPDLGYFNFNGATNGAMTVTVPTGSTVTVRFRNRDPNAPHSVGVARMLTPVPATPPGEPAFAGAISSNPTSMTESTLPGEFETFTFTASEAGEYMLLCYIPGHGLAGMWVRFNVGGEPGVTGAPNVPININ